MHDYNWFYDRIGQTVLRGTTEVVIVNEDVAKTLHTIQSPTYTFSDTSTGVE